MLYIRYRFRDGILRLLQIGFKVIILDEWSNSHLSKFFSILFADFSECASVFNMLMFIYFFLLVKADFVGAELKNVCFVGLSFQLS